MPTVTVPHLRVLFWRFSCAGYRYTIIGRSGKGASVSNKKGMSVDDPGSMAENDLGNASGSDLRGMSMGDLESLVTGLGQPRYRAAQIASWVFEKDVSDFGEMTNLPTSLRDELAKSFTVCTSRVVASERSPSDGTQKLLLEFADGARVEAVVLDDEGRRTACVSTQVGCRFGCAFCATGTMGLERSLSAAEIVEEIMAVRRAAAPERIDNLVFMGMGEPLDNYDAVMSAIRIVNAPWGLGVGARRMTVSTVGLIDGIRRLAGEGLQVNLAVSVNASTQEKREQLMPVARTNRLPDLMAALEDYARVTGRMVTFEYLLLKGVNDSQEDADALARLAARLPCKINLICYNQVAETAFAPPSTDKAERFLARLRRTCPTVVRRQSRGSDISAGCGQLYIARGGLRDRGRTET